MDIDVGVWLRQSRLRAKKYGCFNDISPEDIQALLRHTSNNCGYCNSQPASTLDYLYSLRSGAPNIQANVMPTCQECKTKKGQNTLTYLFNEQHLSETEFLTIIKRSLTLRHGTVFLEYLRSVYGVIE